MIEKRKNKKREIERDFPRTPTLRSFSPWSSNSKFHNCLGCLFLFLQKIFGISPVYFWLPALSLAAPH